MEALPDVSLASSLVRFLDWVGSPWEARLRFLLPAIGKEANHRHTDRIVVATIQDSR